MDIPFVASVFSNTADTLVDLWDLLDDVTLFRGSPTGKWHVIEDCALTRSASATAQQFQLQDIPALVAGSSICSRCSHANVRWPAAIGDLTHDINSLLAGLKVVETWLNLFEASGRFEMLVRVRSSLEEVDVIRSRILARADMMAEAGSEEAAGYDTICTPLIAAHDRVVAGYQTRLEKATNVPALQAEVVGIAARGELLDGSFTSLVNGGTTYRGLVLRPPVLERLRPLGMVGEGLAEAFRLGDMEAAREETKFTEYGLNIVKGNAPRFSQTEFTNPWDWAEAEFNAVRDDILTGLFDQVHRRIIDPGPTVVVASMRFLLDEVDTLGSVFPSAQAQGNNGWELMALAVPKVVADVLIEHHSFVGGFAVDSVDKDLSEALQVTVTIWDGQSNTLVQAWETAVACLT